MPVTINVNKLSLCHQGSGGMSIATLPDVCLTPAPPAPPVPVPYPNIALSADLAQGTTTVFADGGNSCAISPSVFSTSVGDEAGVIGGVASGTTSMDASWLTFSPDVKIEGQAATRLTDKMLQNHGNTMTTGEQQAEVFGTVDDKEVQWWIDDAMAWCANPGRTREQVIDCAWSHLKEQRKPPNCHDANLAAAEHYMYSRKMIAEWPLPNAVLEAYPLGYEALKVALYGTGFVIGIPFEILGVSGDPSFFLGDLFLNLPATGDCPVSPPSLGSLRWGNKGIDDEMAARKQ